MFYLVVLSSQNPPVAPRVVVLDKIHWQTRPFKLRFLEGLHEKTTGIASLERLD